MQSFAFICWLCENNIYGSNVKHEVNLKSFIYFSYLVNWIRDKMSTLIGCYNSQFLLANK